jgi:serine/threonine protein phosphatase PrpC
MQEEEGKSNLSDYFSDTNSVGAFHEENQDSIFVSEADQVFAVADGVGGYRGAKEASQLATKVLEEFAPALDSERALSACVAEISKRIKERGWELHYFEMVTTLALAKVLPGKRTVLTANVGDSPIFLIKKEKMGEEPLLLYKDDSLRYEDPNNLWSINQYLGYGGRLRIHTKSSEYELGDILLLCSDGVSDNILGSSNDLTRLGPLVKENPSAKALVNHAMDVGLKADDMTAILVFL